MGSVKSKTEAMGTGKSSDNMSFQSLESNTDSPFAPLAQRMRPRALDEFVGQKHLLGEGKLLRHLAQSGERASIIFWGPPGSGKTTLCRILARCMRGRTAGISAVLAGVKELRKIVQDAESYPDIPTLLFVDEIHRWNKAQQDALLPYVENGLLTLLGCTTQNPSFEIISPLLSRARVLVLRPLETEEMMEILRAALEDRQRGLGASGVVVDEEALVFLAEVSSGDARVALNQLELAVGMLSSMPERPHRLNLELLKEISQKRSPNYDKDGEAHYNLISAFIKSMRGSDPDAAVYWLARMLDAGEDPRFLARRMIILASEDVGNADPRALQVAVAAFQAFECVGLPEGFLPLAHAAIYLAAAPKSNAVYMAYKDAQKEVKTRGSLPVPFHLRNAPTEMMKQLGYAKGYEYDHDYENAYSGQVHLPAQLAGKAFYQPRKRGYEKKLGEWLAWLKRAHKARSSN